MPFDELTSERVRVLLLTLLREMDPEKYASFFAYFTFGGGSGILLMGVGQTPQRELDDLKGSFERPDLLELRDTGYLRLEDKGDGTLEGRLTKKALDAYADVKRETGVAEQVTSGDADMDDLTERLSHRVLRECGNQQVRLLQDLQVDMVKRGILGSGIEEHGKIEIAITFMDKYAEDMRRELLALARKARGRLERRDTEWIGRRIGRDLDLLKTGQAGCYVKTALGQRQLGDHIQRKKAAVKSELEIEIRTAELEVRAEAARVPARKDLFISHASEDKEAVAKPLAEELRSRGFTVWYDDYEIKLGDSIPKKIDEGLGSRFGVVVLSPSFFAKNWPKKELEALLQREADEGVKVVLPVWHQITVGDVRSHSRLLAMKRAAMMSKGVKAVADEIVEVIQGAAKA